MSATIIRTSGLTRDFLTPARANIRAVDGLNLEIPSGIVFGFLGPNGSGKTTTIRLLLGLLEPTQGSAEVFGLNTRSQAATIREKTGTLLEHTGLYERLTAEDNLEFYGRVYHLPAEERKARIREMLDNIGLWERRKEVVGNWSRGMKQKLAVARALIHRPQLIFLDEPTAGLDPIAAAALREDLLRLASNANVTVFLTTHNLAEAEKLCHQVAVVRAGKLLALGTPEELRGRSGRIQAEIFGSGFSSQLLEKVRASTGISGVRQQNQHLVVDIVPGTALAPVITQLVLGGAQIEEIRKNHASLEEIFLNLVEEDSQQNS